MWKGMTKDLVAFNVLQILVHFGAQFSTSKCLFRYAAKKVYGIINGGLYKTGTSCMAIIVTMTGVSNPHDTP